MITAGGSLAFYAYTTYLQKFLVNTSGFSRQTATWVMTAASILVSIFRDDPRRAYHAVAFLEFHDAHALRVASDE